MPTTRSPARRLAPRDAAPDHRRLRFAAAMALLVVATLAEYSSGLRAPFLFDDFDGIVENATIRRLWPIAGDDSVLHPPARSPSIHRPVVNVSLALNYALNDAIGIDNRGPWAPVSYRVFNIVVHLVSAFLLVAIIRRTLRHGELGKTFSDRADRIALVAGFIWTLHPIQSEALLYTVQRTELLMAACYLGALYCSIRAWDARSRAHAAGWYCAAVVVGLAGMGCKEVMISMPLAVLLYDRAFRMASWRETFRRRWWFYGLLGLTTVALVYLKITEPSSITIGFHFGIAWFEYLYSQCWAIPRYVQLFFWPDRLTLDYGPQMIRDTRGAGGMIVLTALAVSTAAVWIKPRWWGWWSAGGVLVVGIVLSSRSALPDFFTLGMGHRLYGPLALIAAITCFIIAILETARVYARLPRWAWLAGAFAGSAIVVALPVTHIVMFPADASHERDAYVVIGLLLVLSAFSLRALASHLPVSRWGWLGFLGAWFFMTLAPSSSVVPITTEVAAERRIYLPLAAVVVLVLLAVEALRRPLADPADPHRRYWQLGALTAVAIFYVWVSGWLTHRWLEPYGAATLNRHVVLLAAEWTVRVAVAVAVAGVTYLLLRSRASLRAAAFGIIAIILVVATTVRGSMYNDAERIWRDVTVKVPENPRGWDNLGGALLEKGRILEAEVPLRRAVAVEPQYVPAWHKLGMIAAHQGRREEGVGLLERAILLEPNYTPSLSKLGAVLVDLGRPRDAIPYLERALATSPTAGDWVTYGVALEQNGQHEKALNAFDASLRLDPTQTSARISKAGALINVGRHADAVSELRAALALDPRSVVAHANLALAYAGLGQADQAIRAGEDAIRLAPQSAHLAVMVGELLNRFGRFADAEERLMLVMLLAPDDPDALFQLGIARYYLGKREEAIATFRQALQVNGNYRPAREALQRLGALAPTPR